MANQCSNLSSIESNRPLQNGCEDSLTWNLEENCKDIQLKGPEGKTALFHPGWSNGTAGIRGSKALNQRKHYWEIHVSERIFGTSIMLGIGTKDARLYANRFFNMLGENDQSWGLSHRGKLWHNGNSSKYTKAFIEGKPTTIGLLFDGISGTLTYFKDGLNLGVAFSGLENVTDLLYPMISSTACRTEMTLGCTRQEFNSLQDRCRGAILKLLTKEEEVDELEIPRALKRFIYEGLPVDSQ